MRADGTLDELLTDLIDAWKAHRHPRLGDLADVVGREIVRPEIARSKKRADLDAWTTREKARDPADFGALMGAAGGGGQDDVIAHVHALAKREDPRLTRGLIALLENPPYAGVKSRGMLDAILAALEGTRDVRAAVLSRELASRYLEIVHSGTGGYVVEKLGALAARMENLAPTLPPELEAACAKLEARFGPDALNAVRAVERAYKARHGIGSLESAVFASPDEDGPRLVLADALSEMGDPRGELIVLQITRAHGTLTAEQTRREAELTSDRARLASWAQPLSNAGDCKFERGFPASIELFSKPAKSVLGAPAWSTVVRVRGLSRWPKKTVVEWLGNEALRSVRDVGSLHVATLEGLAGRSWPFTHLEVLDAGALTDKTLDPFVALEDLRLVTDRLLPGELLEALTRLRRFRIRGPFSPALVAGHALTSLEIEDDGKRDDAWPLPDSLESISLRTARELPPMALENKPKLHDLELSVRGAKGVEEALGQLPALESLDVAVGEHVPRSLLSRVPQLRSLSMRGTVSNAIRKGLFDALGELRSLETGWSTVEPGTLLPLKKLESLVLRRDIAVGEIPDAPLKKLFMEAPSPADLATLLARLPDLEELHLEIDRYAKEKVPAGELAKVVAASKVRICKMEGYARVTLTREGDGHHLECMGSSMFGIEVGRGVPRLLSVSTPGMAQDEQRRMRKELGIPAS